MTAIRQGRLEFVPCRSESDRPLFLSLPGPGADSLETLERHRPDAQWMAVDGGRVAARSSLWWAEAPPLEGHRVGVIGHYAAEIEAGPELLRHAARELAGHGCTLAVGPMDGNTWRRYRALTGRGSEPPFFLEPDNPDDWAEQFTAAGFAPLAGYVSARAAALPVAHPRAEAAWARLATQGFAIRTLRPDRLAEELAAIYAISRASFAQNFLYTPIPEAEFREQYAAILPYVHPDLVLIAERQGTPAGFLFAIPDLLEARRPGRARSFIVKTLAVDPRYGGLGLGTVMLARANQRACELGFESAIHALMHESNASVRISSREAEVFRRYTLYARPLAP